MSLHNVIIRVNVCRFYFRCRFLDCCQFVVASFYCRLMNSVVFDMVVICQVISVVYVKKTTGASCHLSKHNRKIDRSK